MAAKTERITIRLRKQHLDFIDAMVKIGEVDNRSIAIRTAVKEFVDARSKIVTAKELEARLRQQDEMMTLAAHVKALEDMNQK